MRAPNVCTGGSRADRRHSAGCSPAGARPALTRPRRQPHAL